ncbi:MAG: CHASE2 domain-containing protein [Planctomycetota bacterium]
MVGAAVTAAVCAVHALGWLAAVDDLGLDFHSQHFSRIAADPRIVLVDIDDGTLAAVGEWPWPRRRYAQLVRTLYSLGANQIVLDVTLSEPAPPRYNSAALGAHYDIDPPAEILGDPTDEPPVYDDDELAEAIARSGRTYLSMYARLEGSEEKDTASSPGGASDERRRAMRFLGENPTGTFAEFFEAMSSSATGNSTQVPERSSLLSAYRWASAMTQVRRKCAAASVGARGRIVRATDPTPPLDKFIHAARGAGLVAFSREAMRGTARAVPMVVDLDGTLVPHLGFGVALGMLDIESASIERIGQDICFPRGDRTQCLPLESDGTTLIHWHRPQEPGHWQTSFVHLPAAALLEIADLHQAIADNERRLAIATVELVRVRHRETPAEFEQYARLVQQCNRARRFTDAATPELALVQESIDAAESEAILWLKRTQQLWKDETPRSEEERRQRDEIERLHADFGSGQLADETDAVNQRVGLRIQDLTGRVRPTIEGKVCFVGFAASATGEFVTTPVSAALPGVMVHANVANMVLQDFPLRRASPVVNLLVILLAGSAACAASCVRGLRTSVTGVAVAIAGLAVAGACSFAMYAYYLSTPSAVVAVVSCWAGVTAFRQATEERARRTLQKALAQYTSAPVAARIVERAAFYGLAPTPADVSCFFCDLYRFTEISERLGAARTRDVLNPYLQAVSTALVSHGAIVNKFTGDGAFGFFNAPIWPCANHAAAACRTAVDLVRAMETVNEGLRTSILDAEASTDWASSHNRADTPFLRIRIGVSTGRVFVGDYGSETKLDYTCIGDTVNIGSRLERANKALGTTVLVNDPTRRQAGAEFAFRRIGDVLLPGKSAPVCVHELVGRAAEVSPTLRDFLVAFESMVTHFQACKWRLCADALTACQRLQPSDPASKLYEITVQERLRHPGGDGDTPRGALDLSTQFRI